MSGRLQVAVRPMLGKRRVGTPEALAKLPGLYWRMVVVQDQYSAIEGPINMRSTRGASPLWALGSRT